MGRINGKSDDPTKDSYGNYSERTTLFVLACLGVFFFRDFIFSDDMLYGSDTLGLGYMAREFYSYIIKSGSFPFWNPFILGGTPFIESLAGGDSLYPPSALLLLLLETHRALGWKLILHIIFAGWFMYKWIRSLKVSKNSAFIAAIAYSLSPIMVTLVHGGQDGKIFVIALTPLIFWTTETFLHRPSYRSFSLLSLVISFIILTTHFQMAYFLFAGVGFYAISKIFQTRSDQSEAKGTYFTSRRVKLTMSFMLAAILGLTLSAVQFFPASSYVMEHSRRTSTTVNATPIEARSYSSSWSLHPEELIGLAIPEFVGVSNANEPWSQNTYWGRNGFKGNHEYMGIIVLILSGISLFTRRKVHPKNYLVGMGVVSLLFALGENTPFWGILYEFLPGINLFRAPSLAIFLTGFSVITLMAIGLEEVWTLATTKQDILRWRRIWIFVTSVGCFLSLGLFSSYTGSLASFWTDFIYPDISLPSKQILDNSNDFITKGFLTSLMFLGVLSALFVGIRRNILSLRAATLLIAIVLAVDLGRVDKSFIQTLNFDSFRSADSRIQNLLERQKKETPFRVFSLVGLNGQDVRPGMFGLELVSGHHPNDLARYRNLIGMAGSSLPVNLLTNHNVLKLLNVRYILWPNQLGSPSDQSLPENIADNLTVIPQSGQGEFFSETIYTFPTLERARLVNRAVIIPDDEEALDYILSDHFNPETEVILQEPSPLILGSTTGEGAVFWINRNVNEMELKVLTPQNTFLVLSDNWFPGWKSSVNGVETPILRVNHTLRGIPLPSGEHSIKLYYDSVILNWSFWLTGFSLTILIGLSCIDPLRSGKQ